MIMIPSIPAHSSGENRLGKLTSLPFFQMSQLFYLW